MVLLRTVPDNIRSNKWNPVSTLIYGTLGSWQVISNLNRVRAELHTNLLNKLLWAKTNRMEVERTINKAEIP